MRAPLARWLAAEARAGRGRPRPLPAARRRLRREALRALFAPHVREVRRARRRRQPARRASSARSRRSRRPTRRSTSSSAARCSSTSTTRRAVSPSCTASTPGRARAPLDARDDGLPPEPGRPVALDARRPRAPVRARTATWDSVTRQPGAGTAASLAMLNALYLDHVFRRDAAAAAPSTGRLARQPARPGARRAARPLCASRGPGRSPRTTTSSPRSPRDARSRHGRRRLHRLEPRRARCSSGATRCASSTTSRPGSRGEPRVARPRGRGRRGRPPLVRARAHGRARRRGGLPPGCARLRAALGAGPADLDRGQRRGDAQRPSRGARRGRPARGLRVLVVGVRDGERIPRVGEPGAEPDLAVRASRSSPPSGSASRSPASTGSRPSRSATSTSSARARTRRSQYAAVVPRFIRRSRTAARSRSTGTARQSKRLHARRERRRARTCSPRTPRARAGRVLNIAMGGCETVNDARGDDRPAARHGRSSASTAPTQPGDVRAVVGGRHRRPRRDRLRADGGVRGGPAADDRGDASHGGRR